MSLKKVIPVKVMAVLTHPKWTDDEKWAKLRTLVVRRSSPKREFGAMLEVLVWPDFVIKRWRKRVRSKWLASMASSLADDADYIRRVRRTRYKIHFPDTFRVGNFQVQESVPINVKLWKRFEGLIVRLERDLCLNDMHEWNVGWKKDKTGTWRPVFFDFNLCDERELVFYRR